MLIKKNENQVKHATCSIYAQIDRADYRVWSYSGWVEMMSALDFNHGHSYMVYGMSFALETVSISKWTPKTQPNVWWWLKTNLQHYYYSFDLRTKRFTSTSYNWTFQVETRISPFVRKKTLKSLTSFYVLFSRFRWNGREYQSWS